jgi:Ribbon-helix-helix protein, copG family
MHLGTRGHLLAIARKQGGHSKRKTRSIRVTVSLPRDVHRTMEALANAQKVSMSWVMRDAAERYLADKWPLLGSPPNES